MSAEITRRTFLVGAGLLGASYVVGSGDGPKKHNVSTEAFLREMQPVIAEVAERYQLRPAVLTGLAEMEIGRDGDPSRFSSLGPGKLSEQELKSTLNYLRTIFDPKGGTTIIAPNGNRIHLGYSLGYYNQKPGSLSRTIINGIQNKALQGELLNYYDNRLHHPDAHAFARLVHNNFRNGTEIAAAIISQWDAGLQTYLSNHPEINQDTADGYYMLAHNMSPYFVNGRLYEILGNLAPDLQDK